MASSWVRLKTRREVSMSVASLTRWRICRAATEDLAQNAFSRSEVMSADGYSTVSLPPNRPEDCSEKGR